MHECITCLDEYESVEYKEKDGEWLNSPYCERCINYFIENQWDNYVNTIKTETCKKTIRRMIDSGPPIYVKEPVGMPCENSQGVYEFNFGQDVVNDQRVVSGKLKGVYEGDEMVNYKNFLMNYLETLE